MTYEMFEEDSENACTRKFLLTSGNLIQGYAICDKVMQFVTEILFYAIYLIEIVMECNKYCFLRDGK